MSDIPNPDADRFAGDHARFLTYMFDAMPSPPSHLVGALDSLHDATFFVAATAREHLRQMWRLAHDGRLTAAARREDVARRAQQGWEAARGFAGKAPLATATAERDRLRATALAAAAAPPADARGAELRNDLRALPVQDRALAAQRIVEAAKAGIPGAVEAAKAVFAFNPLLPPFSDFPSWLDCHQAELAAALAPREWAQATHADLVLELHARVLRAAKQALETGAAALGVRLVLPSDGMLEQAADVPAPSASPPAAAILGGEDTPTEIEAQAASVELEDEPVEPAAA